MTDNAVTRTPFVATRRQLLAGGAAVAAVSLATTRATSAQAIIRMVARIGRLPYVL